MADTQLSDSQKVALIDAVVNTENTTASVEKQIDEFKQNVTKLQQGQDYFALLETHSLKLQHRVADIVRQIQFGTNCSKPALWTLCGITSRRMATSTRARQSIFCPLEQRAALTATDGKFRVSLYKALLYVELQKPSSPAR